VQGKKHRTWNLKYIVKSRISGQYAKLLKPEAITIRDGGEKRKLGWRGEGELQFWNGKSQKSGGYI
jgi:hypothetical protein